MLNTYSPVLPFISIILLSLFPNNMVVFYHYLVSGKKQRNIKPKLPYFLEILMQTVP